MIIGNIYHKVHEVHEGLQKFRSNFFHLVYKIFLRALCALRGSKNDLN